MKFKWFPFYQLLVSIIYIPSVLSFHSPSPHFLNPAFFRDHITPPLLASFITGAHFFLSFLMFMPGGIRSLMPCHDAPTCPAVGLYMAAAECVTRVRVRGRRSRSRESENPWRHLWIARVRWIIFITYYQFHVHLLVVNRLYGIKFIFYKRVHKFLKSHVFIHINGRIE